MKTLYKFLRTGLKSYNGKKRDWEIGVWRKEEEISICNYGFHASKTPLQALGYVKGEILAKVEVRGDSAIEEDKECWSEMRITKAYHWKKENSVALAIYAAELVIDIFEKKHPNDKRPREAIEAAKAWLKNPNSKNTKAAYAASYAASYAAKAAAYAASAYAAKAAAYAADASAIAYAAADYAAAASDASAIAYAAAASDASASDASAIAYAAAAYAASADKEFSSKLDKWFIKEIKKLEPYE